MSAAPPATAENVQPATPPPSAATALAAEARAAGLVLPLVRGPLRGCWWLPASGGKIARLLLGTYEREQSALFCRHIRPGQQVIDIGAAAGYYTLLAARLVGPNGQVVACEPDRTNLAYLCRHVRANGLRQVTVLPVAIAEQAGTFRFGGGTGTGTGRLCDDGAHEVAVQPLDELCVEHDLRPDHVKIDVEGSELAVLRGGQRTIREHRPIVFLSTHEWIVPGVHTACRELLESWHYRIEPITGTSASTASEVLCIPD